MKIYDEAINVLMSEIKKYVQIITKNLDFDRTYTGIVSAVNSDGYTVKYNGTDIKIKTSATNVLNINDIVKFCVPCGNKRKAYLIPEISLSTNNNGDSNVSDSHINNGSIHVSSTDRTNWNNAKKHADSAHAPSDAQKNQNAFSNVKVGTTTVTADITTDTLEIAAGTGISVAGDATNDKVTITNSGVRSIATGTSNGTISVNTNGTSVNVAVKGLGSAAYTASTAYDASGTAQTKANAALSSAKTYTDTAISNLINSAPTTLDTLGEIATAMEENADVVSALEEAIGKKENVGHTHNYAGSSSAGGAATSANKINTDAGNETNPVYFANGIPVKTKYTLGKSVPSDAKFTDTVYTHPTHTQRESGLYKITVDAYGHVYAVSNVTKDDITSLGIPSENSTYTAAGTNLGLVKSGGDVTISNGQITVNDDSHNHVVSNIDGLSDTLNGKVPTTRKINGKVLSKDISLSASDVGATTEQDVLSLILNNVGGYKIEKVPTLPSSPDAKTIYLVTG